MQAVAVWSCQVCRFGFAGGPLVGWAGIRGAGFRGAGFRGTGAGGYTSRYGQGSLWTGAWIRGAGGDEDAGDRGGRGYGGESFGQRLERGCEWRTDAAVAPFDGCGQAGHKRRGPVRWRGDGSNRARYGGQEGSLDSGPDGGAGSRGRAGSAAREAALLRGDVG